MRLASRPPLHALVRRTEFNTYPTAAPCPAPPRSHEHSEWASQYQRLTLRRTRLGAATRLQLFHTCLFACILALYQVRLTAARHRARARHSLHNTKSNPRAPLHALVRRTESNTEQTAAPCAAPPRSHDRSEWALPDHRLALARARLGAAAWLQLFLSGVLSLSLALVQVRLTAARHRARGRRWLYPYEVRFPRSVARAC